MAIDPNAYLGDEFTGANQTALQDHMPTFKGNSWLKQSFGSSNTNRPDDAEIQTNELQSRSQVDESAAYRLAIAIPNTVVLAAGGYDMFMDIIVTGPDPVGYQSDLAILGWWQVFGSSHSQNNRVSIEYEHGTGNWFILQIKNGVLLSSSANRTPLTSGTHKLLVQVRDPNVPGGNRVGFTIFVDSVPIFSTSYPRGGSGIWIPDVHYFGVATAGWGTGDVISIDNFEIVPIKEILTGSETLGVDFGAEVATLSKLTLKAGNETLGVDFGAETATKLVQVLKTANETLGVDFTAETATKVATTDLLLKVGLLSDVEPSLVLSHWPANNFLIPALLGTLATGGFVLNTSLNKLTISSRAEDQQFRGMAAFHLASMFASGRDQRGAQRIYLSCSRESGDKIALRGTLKSPVGSFPMTQDAPNHEEIAASIFRHLDIGMFSWPPALGGAGKIRSGVVAHRPDSDNLDAFKGVEIQGIAEDVNTGILQLSAIDLLPVEDGFFALMGIKDANAAALQATEVLVMDKIDNPSGGHLLKQSEDKSSELEINDIGSVTPMAILGDGFMLQPSVSNLISVIAGGYNSSDDQGAVSDAILFEVSLDYEPRFLFF